MATTSRVQFTTDYNDHKRGQIVTLDAGAAASLRAAGVARNAPTPAALAPDTVEAADDDATPAEPSRARKPKGA